jgi:hypothetical protein
MESNTIPRFALHIYNYYPRLGATNEVSQTSFMLFNSLKTFYLGNFSQEFVDRVTQMALSDRDEKIRLEALTTVSKLALKTEILPLIRNFPAKNNQASIQNVTDIAKFEAGILDPDWRMRRAWVKFAGTQIDDSKPLLFVL